MAGVIDTAYVRLRPTSQGFQQEAEAGIKAGLRNVRNIIGGAFAAAGVFEAGKAIIQAAAEHQSAFAVVEQTLKNAHQSTDLYGVSVESLIEKEARLKGFHDEALAQSFTRLVSATHDSAKAFTDLGLAEDIARARHLDVTIVSLALARAAQGSTQSLSRLGIVIPKVSTEVAALTRRHDEAVAAGAKFSKAQQLIYKDALAAAAANDKAANSVHAFQVASDRFGGTAAKFAQTASGQFARAGQDIHQLEVAVGRDALPAITTLAEGVGHYAEALTHSQSVQDAVKSGLHDIGAAAHDVKDVVETVGPTFLAAAKGAADLASAIGSPAILAAIGTYKALGLATGAVTAAESLYQRALLAGAAERVAATTATAGLTAAEEAQVIAATAAAGGTRTLATGLFALATRGGLGTGGLLTLGVAGLAGGFVYLATRENDVQRASDQLRTSLGLLAGELNTVKDLANQVAQSKIDVALAKDAKAAADAVVQQAQATEVATRGTSEHAAAVLALKTARDQDRAAALNVTQAEDRARDTVSKAGAARKQVALDRQDELRATLALFAAEEKRSQSLARGAFAGAPPGPTRTAAIAGRAAELDAQAAAKISATLSGEAQKLQDKNPGLATSVRLLSQYIAAVGRLPTRAETKFILDPTNARRSLTGIVNALRTQVADAQVIAKNGGVAIGKALADGIPQGVTAATPAVFSAVHALVRGAVSSGKGAAEARSPSAATAREIGLPLAQGIALGIDTGAPEVQRALSDTVGQAISQGGQQVADAINQAKQNLNSIGSSLASTVGQFIDAGPLGSQIKQLQEQLTVRQNRAQRQQLEQSVAQARKALTDAQAAVGPPSSQSRQERRVLNEFLAPQRQALSQAQAGLEDFKAQQRITALQGRADALKTATTRGIADLTDEFNKGAISARRFNVGLAALLAKDDIDYRRAGKTLGVAFADGFAADLGGLRDQIAAMVGVPKLPGAGLAPTIVRPLQTIADVTKQVAQAQKDRDNAALAEQKKTNKHLADISAKQKAADFTRSITPTSNPRAGAARTRGGP